MLNVEKVVNCGLPFTKNVNVNLHVACYHATLYLKIIFLAMILALPY
jgi:hypothetical protein